jgi:hypothetical protein
MKETHDAKIDSYTDLLMKRNIRIEVGGSDLRAVRRSRGCMVMESLEKQ